MNVLVRQCESFALAGIWRDTGAPEQRWKIVARPGGYIAILDSTDDGTEINVCGHGRTDGSQIIIYTHRKETRDVSDINEQWYLSAVN